MDCARQERQWTLLHLARAQDGSLRILRQRAHGPRPDHTPTKGVRWKNEPQGKDHADPRQQSDCV